MSSANLPDTSIEPYSTTLQTGVHYGWARVLTPTTESHDDVYPMVMSIGWNPFYENTHRTAVSLFHVEPSSSRRADPPDTRAQEVHILHDYPHDFYGKELRVVILGFIRPEYNYAGLGASCLSGRARRRADRACAPADALIKDINTDKEVSLRSVEREAYVKFKEDAFFSRPSELSPPTYDPNAVRVKPSAL